MPIFPAYIAKGGEFAVNFGNKAQRDKVMAELGPIKCTSHIYENGESATSITITFLCFIVAVSKKLRLTLKQSISNQAVTPQFIKIKVVILAK